MGLCVVAGPCGCTPECRCRPQVTCGFYVLEDRRSTGTFRSHVSSAQWPWPQRVMSVLCLKVPAKSASL